MTQLCSLAATYKSQVIRLAVLVDKPDDLTPFLFPEKEYTLFSSQDIHLAVYLSFNLVFLIWQDFIRVKLDQPDKIKLVQTDNWLILESSWVKRLKL